MSTTDETRPVEGTVMPHDLKTLVISVLYQKGDSAFICGAHGPIGGIEDIEQDMNDNTVELFESGDGYYLFKATHERGQYGDYGRCEFQPHWELTLLEYRKINISDA